MQRNLLGPKTFLGNWALVSKLKAIKAIKSRKKMDLTIGMKDSNGLLKHDKASIVEVFAQFYEDLYRSRRNPASACPGSKLDAVSSGVPKFDAEELESGLRSLKSGKAKDSKGFVAEMLKVGSSKLRKVLLELMNACLDVGARTPQDWHENVLKILFKGGDASHAKKYRPICVMPLLYKLLL